MEQASLMDRKADVRGRVEMMRRQRAADILSGKRFKDAEALAAAETELDALDDAEAEAGRRARQAAEEAETRRRLKLRGEISVKAKAYFVAVSKADAATRDLVSALIEARTLAGEISKLFAVSGERTPRGSDPAAFDRRFSERLSAQLKTISGHAIRWGDLELATAWRKPGENWLTSEEKELATLMSLVNNGNGKD